MKPILSVRQIQYIPSGRSLNEPIIGIILHSQLVALNVSIVIRWAIYQETAQIEMEHAESVGGEITKPGSVSETTLNASSMSQSERERSDQVFTVGLEEDAVTIQIEVEGHCISAILDTGARPNVVEYNTLQDLNLNQNLVDRPGQVFGLCDNPIKVLGYLDTEVRMGRHRL